MTSAFGSAVADCPFYHDIVHVDLFSNIVDILNEIKRHTSQHCILSSYCVIHLQNKYIVLS